MERHLMPRTSTDHTDQKRHTPFLSPPRRPPPHTVRTDHCDRSGLHLREPREYRDPPSHPQGDHAAVGCPSDRLGPRHARLCLECAPAPGPAYKSTEWVIPCGPLSLNRVGTAPACTDACGQLIERDRSGTPEVRSPPHGTRLEVAPGRHLGHRLDRDQRLRDLGTVRRAQSIGAIEQAMARIGDTYERSQVPAKPHAVTP